MKEVSYKEASKYAKANFAQYFESSSKEGTGVEEMFQAIANRLFQIQT